MGQYVSTRKRQVGYDNNFGEAGNLLQLSQDWENEVSHKEFCDVQILCGDKTFDCHQLVLAVRSPVFRAMFRADMKEKKTKKVNV